VYGLIGGDGADVLEHLLLIVTGQVAHDLADETALGSIGGCHLRQVVRNLPSDYKEKMLKNVRAITTDQIKGALRKSQLNTGEQLTSSNTVAQVTTMFAVFGSNNGKIIFLTFIANRPSSRASKLPASLPQFSLLRNSRTTMVCGSEAGSFEALLDGLFAIKVRNPYTYLSIEYRGKNVRAITTDQIKGALRKIILPLFDPKTANMVVTRTTWRMKLPWAALAAVICSLA
jgi:hypothetical protein